MILPGHNSIGRSWPRRFAIRVVLFCVVVLYAANAAQPRIDHIERFGSDQVTIHFDTEANRSYLLQYRLSFTNNWSTLFSAPAYPFSNHYVVTDTGTNKMRMYRLTASP